MSYDRWKTQAPDLDGPEEPSYEQQKADYEDEMQQKDLRPACPLCRGAGFVTYRDGIPYEAHDVEREEHLIEDCPECKGDGLSHIHDVGRLDKNAAPKT